MTERPTNLLYFAYGSNMAIERLQSRIPSARKYCKASLAGYRLTFHKKGKDGSGKCDVVKTLSASDIVHGVLFHFDASEKPILDKIEGPKYQEQIVKLTTEHNETVEAFLYVVTNKNEHTDPSLKPFCWYHHHVLYGARQAQLPAHYISSINHVQTEKDTDLARIEKELSIYQFLDY